jgi:hypothetical protein
LLFEAKCGLVFCHLVLTTSYSGSPTTLSLIFSARRESPGFVDGLAAE